MSDDELLTRVQVAGKLNISERVIQSYVDSGALRYMKIGKQVRFRWRDVEAWQETLASTHPATLTVTPPATKRTQAVPDDTSQPVVELVRGPKRHKSAPSVQQRS